jgi:predicted nucleic acid-binding protein
MPKSKIVFCDTGFVICLLDKSNKLHDNAVGYFRFFLEHGYTLRMSTIAVAEYCVKGNIEDIPLKNILLSPFNAFHASEAGKCGKLLYDARSKGALVVNARILILNDVKMMAQAECEGAEYYLTADSNSKNMYNLLHNKGKITFDFTDINHPYTEKFGLLDM